MCFVLQDFYMQGVLIHIANGPPLYPKCVFCRSHATSPKIMGKGHGQIHGKRQTQRQLYDSGSSSPGAVVFSSGSGPGPGGMPAAVSDMRIDINNGHSYYMTVACRRRRRFFL